ncbi:hypothetical protein IFM89_004558 [Coptis chinensis]|uniref:Mitotic checkpoint protein BUB3.3 n=1 Tax=Coptis chinensis TaxID=261450 RepID=A0A835LH23_9MAGN|nr:hypothetical protein IFM89_004558 [Coptis chinensis]
MEGNCLKFENPVQDAISRIQFAPHSNNLLISSWDSTLRLYDVESCTMRLEITSEAALLGCCFQNESTAFSIAADFRVTRHNFAVGTCQTVGYHHDLPTCVEYSQETGLAISAGLDNRLCSWDLRVDHVEYSKNVGGEVEAMSIHGVFVVVAIGTSISIYDLRNLKEPVHLKEPSMDYGIRSVCSFPNGKGHAVSLQPMYFANCLFRCHPKPKDGKYHLVAVNDIVFHPSIHGAFVTGDEEGYAIMWAAQSKKRLYQFQRYGNSVASLSYNCEGELLAVASSYNYQEATESEQPPQVFIHRMNENDVGSSSIKSSK